MSQTSTDTPFDLKHRSRALTEGPQRAAARAYLKGIGYDDDALAKPIIGVASTWIETMPCNFHLRALAAKVKEGIREAGGTPMEFNTIAISDGITMGTSGMKTSLVSREVIADSIELVAKGHYFDGVVALSGCDKTIPGTVMALARLDVPSVMLYGGSIPPGRFQGRDVTIIDVFEAVGKHAIGEMTDEELAELESVASPGAGACGGQFTANTMAMAFEMLGISPMGPSGVPAQEATKAQAAFDAGKLVMELLKRILRPSDLITKASLENAIAAVTSSMLSATTSRETRLVFMPLVPMVMPSEIATVLNSIGVPPAALTPSLTCLASARRWKLHGIVSIQVLATPMIGFESASSS